MSSLIDVNALLTVLVVSFVGANGLVVAFGAVIVGAGRYGDARSRGGSAALYATLAVLGALVCVALVVLGLYAILGG